jgi:hypothetical protein
MFADTNPPKKIVNQFATSHKTKCHRCWHETFRKNVNQPATTQKKMPTLLG